MDILWSTRDVPAARRSAAWAAALSRQVFPVRTETDRPERFHGEFRMRSFGPSAFLRVRSVRQIIRRAPEDIGPHDVDWMFVSTMTEGTGYLHHADGVATVPQGAVSFVDGGMPFALEFRRPFAYVSGVVRRRDLLALLPAADRAHGTVIPSPAGPALSGFLAALEPASGDGLMDEHRLYDHFVGLAATALAPFVQADANVQAGRDAALIAHVRAHLLTHLDGHAPIAATAQRLGISRRTIQRLFQAEGTTATLWIRNQRIERCARDLRDPRLAGRSITDIASARGFDDAAYFSRCFRATFGMSPRTYRDQKG
jgi:AraC-like DNA-binding protein